MYDLNSITIHRIVVGMRFLFSFVIQYRAISIAVYLIFAHNIVWQPVPIAEMGLGGFCASAYCPELPIPGATCDRFIVFSTNCEWPVNMICADDL